MPYHPVVGGHGRDRLTLERYLSRGTAGLSHRNGSTARRLSAFTLIAVASAAYSVPFYLAVVGRHPATTVLVVVGVVCGSAFIANRWYGLRHPTEQGLEMAAHGLIAIASLYVTAMVAISGGTHSSLVAYIVIAPVAATYLVGARGGLIWGAVTAALVVGLGLVHVHHPIAFPGLAPQLSFVALLTVLAVASKRVADRQVESNERLSAELAAQNAKLGRQSTQLAEARDRAEAASVSHQNLFEAGFENSPIGLALSTVDGTFLRINPALSAMLGYTSAELLGRNFTDVSHPDDLLLDARALRSLQTGQASTHTSEKRFRHRQGRTIWARLSVATLISAEGELDGYFSQIEDITEKRRHDQDLTYQASHDSLTGLANRAQFLERLSAATHRLGTPAGRTPEGEPVQLVVLFVDIDQFKILNDSLGHAMGDRLLIGVAERLRDRLEKIDTVARFGGDEFAVFAEIPVGSLDMARTVADQVHEALREPFVLQGQIISATASIGIVVSSDPAAAATDLLRHADAAMYRAKAEGRATSRLFDEQMRTSLTRRYGLARKLGTALDHGELRLHYQPEVDLLTNTIVGVEALVRWQHPTEGLLPAATFIDIAEESGLIVPIGAWVLEEALRQSRLWPPTTDGGSIVTRINLSANQLTQDDFAKEVSEMFDRAGVSPSTVSFELTESTLIETGVAAMDNIHALRALGINFAIDDFGTGYSSFTYLKQIPADVLKIDLSFVRGLITDERDRHIVASIVRLAHDLGFGVVAEGVEVEEQAEILRSLGCRRAQGYLWGRPAPAEEIDRLLR